MNCSDMIREFAVEPEILKNWDIFRFFVDHFGVEHGRLISMFPGNWFKRVWDTTQNCSDVERKRIEVRLEQCKSEKMISRGRYFDFNYPWLENALRQHGRTPFHAIVAADNPHNESDVLRADEVSADDSCATEKWRACCEQRVPRTPTGLLVACRTLIEISEEIVIVDPRIDLGVARWRDSLVPIIRHVCAQKPRRFEIHTKLKDGQSSRTRETADELRTKCSRYLPEMTPAGSIVRFVAWSSWRNGENLHARYFLTDRGGVRVDAGFDKGNNGEVNDVSLLRREMYEDCWNDYRCDPSPGQKFCLEVDVSATGTSEADRRMQGGRRRI